MYTHTYTHSRTHTHTNTNTHTHSPQNPRGMNKRGGHLKFRIYSHTPICMERERERERDTRIHTHLSVLEETDKSGGHFRFNHFF